MGAGDTRLEIGRKEAPEGVRVEPNVLDGQDKEDGLKMVSKMIVDDREHYSHRLDWVQCSASRGT
jgi:hypothetical protein